MGDFQDTLIISASSDELIKNTELRDYLKFKLDKTNIVKEDLLNVREISLNGKTIDGDLNIVYFSDLDLMPNIERITISDVGISKENITKLSNIKSIRFINCTLEELNGLENVIDLSIINTNIDNIDYIENFVNLTSLEIDSIELPNFRFLKNINNLKKLSIKNIFNLPYFNIAIPNSVEYLALSGFDNILFDSFKNYPNLKTLSLDIDDYYKFEYEISILRNNNISVIMDDIYRGVENG